MARLVVTHQLSGRLLERVRRQAQEHHRSLNDWVTTVLAAASDPAMAGTEAERVAMARAAAGRGTPLSDLVADGRR